MRHTPQKGFTLLETVIAIGIIAVGLLSIVSLSTSSLVTGEATEEEFIATNLAREAIEIVRATRDSNWLAYDADSVTAWNLGLFSGKDYSAIIAEGESPELQFGPDTFAELCDGAGSFTYTCSTLWLNATAGSEAYFQASENHSPALNPNTTPKSIYSRMVFLYPICRNGDDVASEQILTEGAVCTAPNTQVGIDVVAEVQWTHGSVTRSSILEEKLYEWQ